MAGSKFIVVSGMSKKANPIAFQLRKFLFRRCRHGNILPGDGMTIFQPRHAHVAGRDTQSRRDLPAKEFRAHIALFDPQKEMIAAAARLVSRYLLDLEIFGLGLDLSADAWKVSRQEGRNQRCEIGSMRTSASGFWNFLHPAVSEGRSSSLADASSS